MGWPSPEVVVTLACESSPPRGSCRAPVIGHRYSGRFQWRVAGMSQPLPVAPDDPFS
jgi:hypothetical protein